MSESESERETEKARERERQTDRDRESFSRNCSITGEVIGSASRYSELYNLYGEDLPALMRGSSDRTSASKIRCRLRENFLISFISFE